MIDSAHFSNNAPIFHGENWQVSPFEYLAEDNKKKSKVEALYNHNVQLINDTKDYYRFLTPQNKLN